MPPVVPFNPLDKRNLAGSVAEALLGSPLSPLPPREPFDGVGIYAIYYFGPFAPYQPILNAKQRIPIYVGKAIPKRARKGGFGLAAAAGQVLYRRLREHAEAIQQTSNMKSSDFKCQYLVTDDIWIPLGESLLIEMFRPIWNMAIDGFENHDPGSGWYNQRRAPWDVIHPGRPWAVKCKPCSQTPKQILERLELHLAKLKSSGLLP